MKGNIDLSEAAAMLGRRNLGRKKTLSASEKLRRRLLLAEVRKLRWVGRSGKAGGSKA